MWPLLCTLRGHFFKHLSYAGEAFFFSISRDVRRGQHSVNSFLLAESKRQWKLDTVDKMFSVSSASCSPHDCSPSEPFTSPYLSVRISCPKNIVDTLSEALLCFGASSASIDENEGQGDNDNNEVFISSIFSVSHDITACISQASNCIGLKELPRYDVEMLDHTDWIRKTQESFLPVKVLEDLWIIPEWTTPPDVLATNIILNPGLAFGTGDHPTTKLCLSLLHHSIKGGEFFFDYGTGSGILAIAALKMGAVFSVGVDIDPQAILSAQHNAVLNKIESVKLHLQLVHGKASTSCVEDLSNSDMNWKNSFDLVIANILLNPLLDLAEDIVSYAKPGAIVAVSGIISDQVSKIDDWACVSGTKKRESVA